MYRGYSNVVLMFWRSIAFIILSDVDNIPISCVWYQQSFANSIWLRKAFKQKITDVYIQKWISQIKVTSDSNCYKIFKTHFGQSKYISTLPKSQCKSLIRFRTGNHKLPVEVGRWKSVPLNERLCIYCNELGDEFHYLMSCKHFEAERKQCLKSYFTNVQIL